MIADIYTMMWKEIKLLQEGSGSRDKLWPLIFLVVFGVALPIQMGRTWLETPVSMGFLVTIPLILVASWVADSFAGERERHTLEALLATRLSDRAILFGKVAALVGYAWGMGLVAMAMGMITVNLARWEGAVLLYAPAIGLGIVCLSFLVATLAANAGVLVSLRAATVRQAQQTVGIGLMVAVWVPILALNFLPTDLKRALLEAVESAGQLQIVLVIAGILLAFDLLLLAATMARFQRTRLILDQN